MVWAAKDAADFNFAIIIMNQRRVSDADFSFYGRRDNHKAIFPHMLISFIHAPNHPPEVLLVNSSNSSCFSG